MEITYDRDVDALYIRLTKGKFAKNKVIGDLNILDIDNKDNILGIEIVNASKKLSIKSLKHVTFKER